MSRIRLVMVSLLPRTFTHRRPVAGKSAILLFGLMAALAVGVFSMPTVASAAEVAQACTPTMVARAPVSLRRGPGVNYNPRLALLRTGDIAQITGRLRNNSWYRVLFNNQAGWVAGTLVTASCLNNAPIVPATPVPNVINTANFRAVPNTVALGACSTLSWNVQNVAGVYFVEGNNATGVAGVSNRVVCPTTTTQYVLLVQRRDGTSFTQAVTVNVGSQPNFRADATTISAGQCTTLRWNIDQVAGVYLITGNNAQGVPGNFAQQVCPPATTAYVLRVQRRDSTTFDTSLTITVNSNQPNFRADATTVNPGQCTTLRWGIDNVNAVYFIENGNIQGVPGNGSRQVCPSGNTTYVLRVQRRDGTTFDSAVTVVVNNGGQPNFRADTTSINLGQCTTLRWGIDNVRGVWFWEGNNRQGVAGNSTRQVCPTATTLYRLEVLRNDGSTGDYYVSIAVNTGPPPSRTVTPQP